MILTASELRALAQATYASARGEGGDASVVPDSLVGDRGPRRVLLTSSDGVAAGQVFDGQGDGLSAAVQDAVEKMRSESVSPRWLAIDVVERVDRPPFPPEDFSQTAGLRGLMTESGEAILPQQVVAAGLVDDQGVARPKRIQSWLTDRGRQAHGAGRLAGRFTALSAFADQSGVELLYRGHRKPSELTKASVLTAAKQGGRYLAAAVKPDGRFVYRYWPKSDRDRGGYNVLRHAGTTYSMYELLADVRDPGLFESAERAVGRLLEFAEPCPPPALGESCIAEDGFIKLGGNALAILALAQRAEVTGDRQHLGAMRSFGRAMLAVQKPSGEFSIHKQRASDGAVAGHISIYYPGEALLALLRLHRLDPEGPWLSAAERGTRWLIEVRDRDLDDDALPHDHWLLYALNELYRLRPDPIFLEQGLRIAGAIVAAQNRSPEYPDWLGSFYVPPRSTPASTRIEGLNAAYRLARDFADPVQAEMLREAIDLGIRYLLQHQFRPESAIHLPNPQRALGGFRRSYRRYEIRIDYVQHAISALLGCRYPLGLNDAP